MDREETARRSAQMSRIRSKDTKPELFVRGVVHGMGYRYRLHRRDLPGSPDLVFPTRRKVIFVHGCFWHRHPDPSCPLTRTPKSRLEFWLPKFDANQRRDTEKQLQLRELGWEILILWECQLRDVEFVKTCVKEFLGK
ncbi:MAG: very short patch repair endonuclease [Thermomicrobiales bacterium]